MDPPTIICFSTSARAGVEPVSWEAKYPMGKYICTQVPSLGMSTRIMHDTCIYVRYNYTLSTEYTWIDEKKESTPYMCQ
jgi:hypothetical protein